MKFVKFTENNDWEGETWRFWLQLDGNESELKKLKGFFDKNDVGEAYELDMTPVDEEEVDTLVKHSRQGYMNYDNKVTGTFTMPEYEDDGQEDSAYEWANDHFYKGDVERCFE